MIVGIRPEDFEDAALVGEHRDGHRLSALIDVLETTGSDVYAHLAVEQGGGAAGLEPVTIDPREAAAAPAPEIVARLDASSALREGRTRAAVARHDAHPPVRRADGRAPVGRRLSSVLAILGGLGAARGVGGLDAVLVALEPHDRALLGRRLDGAHGTGGDRAVRRARRSPRGSARRDTRLARAGRRRQRARHAARLSRLPRRQGRADRADHLHRGSDRGRDRVRARRARRRGDGADAGGDRRRCHAHGGSGRRGCGALASARRRADRADRPARGAQLRREPVRDRARELAAAAGVGGARRAPARLGRSWLCR